MPHTPSITIYTNHFQQLLKKYTLSVKSAAQKNPITTLIISIAFAALGMIVADILVLITPITMLVIRVLIDTTLITALAWIAYHAADSLYRQGH